MWVKEKQKVEVESTAQQRNNELFHAKLKALMKDFEKALGEVQATLSRANLTKKHGPTKENLGKAIRKAVRAAAELEQRYFPSLG
ncbi:hypothetical protein IC235_12970 [Hymenobacter sp. BT664]|uniref:Uncharacterized protein n=1 Tax=Hymenobacter montanus TaxID=2771359 RepID=A0A927BDG1_9BACT|nr:hypothetical protein [Hymenobacter montanus]MBD2768800.1 hypothetical protein [Hymenobacter montanus]